MHVRYHHKQTGWVLIVGFPATLVAFLVLSGFLAAQRPAPSELIPLAVGAVLFTLLIVFFSSMTVEVTDAELIWYFGPRIWKNRLPLSEIERAARIRAKWYWGYGIKYFGPNRWLYNVSGLGAVEVTLEKGGWIRIGTDDADGLVRALRERGL